MTQWTKTCSCTAETLENIQATDRTPKLNISRQANSMSAAYVAASA